MKQRVISYLSTQMDSLYKLNKFLYDNPEESYKEEKSSKYICDFLKEHEFIVEENFLNIENSFLAKKGSGHPKICYLCEYDSIKDAGHITGHNLLTTMSIGAAIGLGHVIDNIGGSVILIGCPGEYLGGTKETMVKQGVFDDIDAVFEAHPDIVTCESGTSSAILPLSVSFLGNSGLNFLNKDTYTSLDAILMCFSIINSLTKGFPKDAHVDSILSKGGYTPLLMPLESEAKFYIRAKEMSLASCVESKIRDVSTTVSNLMGIEHKASLYEPPSEELLTNITMSRIFSHNLKESGIIDILEPRDVYAGLSLGSVSHKVPCIHPYISIVPGNSRIKYGTSEFAEATLSEFAKESSLKAIHALIFSGIDLIESENLLCEVKNEFFTFKKDSIY